VKTKINIIALSILTVLILTSSVFPRSVESDSAAAAADSIRLITQYSLFSEYFKNKDYQSAMPYAWNVLKMNPKKFSKWIFFKMEDALWYLHDSSNASQEGIKAIDDTIRYFYDISMKYYPKSKGYFEARKAFVSEAWLNMNPDSVIQEYQQAIKDDSTISTYYYNMLGQLYKNNASNKNNYKDKAIDLYTYLNEKEPGNPQWTAELESLVENIKQLVDLRKKSWEMDKNNLSKAWNYAVTAIKAEMYPDAINALDFLTTKVPGNVNYWVQLASVYQRTDNFDKAEAAYKKLIQLKPDNKDYYLNLGVVYKDQNRYAQARTEFLKANDIAKGWGLAIYDEGLLYEQAARACEFNFETKLVYLLAVETYKKALSIDPSLAQAKERINALSSSIPAKEDYFFRGYKSGQVIPITGNCYGWVNKSVTVP
jgi:tetratricopeptide (TPR) repeat protein